MVFSPNPGKYGPKKLRIRHEYEILHSENVNNSSFEGTLMRDHLLVYLQLEKFSQFPKINKGVYRCKSVPLFFDAYCICREAYFDDDIKSDEAYLWQTAAIVENGTTRSA